MKLSIIIVTYNSERDILPCLESIERYNDLPAGELEIIVVDNGSTDETLNIVSNYPGLRLIKNTQNGGYGQGNNIGVRAATAPVCLIMNPDVRLKEPIFEKALKILIPHSLLGMVQEFPDRKANRSFFLTWRVNGYLRVALTAILNRLNWFWPSCMYIQGSCFFLNRERFLAVGGFDESNFMYGEEEDLHYRLKARYGSRGFKFARNLHYIHLAGDRPESIEYEIKLIEANLRLYRNKGVNTKPIIRHMLQANRLLSWRKCSPVLKQVRQHLILNYKF